MHRWNSVATQVIALIIMIGSAHAFDDSLYPDLKGQWTRATPDTSFDPGKPPGRGQQAPLTAEYQAIFEASLADQKLGGQGNNVRFTCMPSGMPRTMTLAGLSSPFFGIAISTSVSLDTSGSPFALRATSGSSESRARIESRIKLPTRPPGRSRGECSRR